MMQLNILTIDLFFSESILELKINSSQNILPIVAQSYLGKIKKYIVGLKSKKAQSLISPTF